MNYGSKGKKKMAMGGMAGVPPTAPMAGMPPAPGMMPPAPMAMPAAPMYAKGGGVEKKGKTKGKTVKMAKGGMVGKASKRADGVAQRGKTKCKMV
jgi:hypothetical protein